MGMLSSSSVRDKSMVSLTAICVGIVTPTNSVRLSLCRRAPKDLSLSWAFSILSVRGTSRASSSSPPWLGCWPKVKMDLTSEDAPSRVFLIARTLPRDLSRSSGAARRRKVCPVGAVSITMEANFSEGAEAEDEAMASDPPLRSVTKSMIFAMAKISSNPGGGLLKRSPRLRFSNTEGSRSTPTSLSSPVIDAKGFEAPFLSFSLRTPSLISSLALCGSISIAQSGRDV